LTSGTLHADADGLFLQPDAFWSRVFAPAAGWYVVQWGNVGVVELARGGRYSVLRARLRVIDHDGARVFRGEVNVRAATAMLDAAQPRAGAFTIEPAPRTFAARRYVLNPSRATESAQ
jgi:hypothetical protein